MLNATGVIIMLAAVAIIGIVLLAVIAITRGHSNGQLDREQYQQDWLTIENGIIKDNNASYQFAILSADKLLDKALRESGVKGETMGERLKHAESRFQDINKVWTAHKLRNQIAHEVHGDINPTVARRMLKIYKSALKDIGAI